jgi:hypothetical protein
MATQVRITIELPQLLIFVRQLRDDTENKQQGKLADKLATKYLRALEKQRDKAVRQRRGGRADDALMARIVHALSVLTGYPEDQILPGSTLANLGVTPTKREQSRIHINRYIREQGGTKTISAGEMAGVKTVQDFYNIAKSKMP